jgi:hypothetical protein
LQYLYDPAQLYWVKIAAQLNAPALDQYYRYSAWTFAIRCAAPTDYFDSHQPFAIGLDAAGLYSFSLESALQRLQRHAVDPQNSLRERSLVATHLQAVGTPAKYAPSAQFNFFGFRHPSTSAKSTTKW